MHDVAESDIFGLTTALFKYFHLLRLQVELVVASVELLALEGREALRCFHQIACD